MALDVSCRTCGTDDHVVLAEELSGSQRRLRCTQCGSEWLRGEPAPERRALPTLIEIRQRFPKPGDVAPERIARAERLKAEFLLRAPQPDPHVDPYWRKYQGIFSSEGIAQSHPQDLKDLSLIHI